MSKRAWLAFATIQTIGCILGSYGTVYSESSFVRGSSLVGFLLLLPGNLPALAVSQMVIHVRTAYIFFPMAIVCNAILWIVCSTLWRTLRRTNPQNRWHRYSIALAATGLGFVVLNTVHFLRPVTCGDCFFPYGLPFTLYQAGGFAGGAGLVWRGLAADIGCVIGLAVLIGRIWTFIARPRATA